MSGTATVSPVKAKKEFFEEWLKANLKVDVVKVREAASAKAKQVKWPPNGNTAAQPTQPPFANVADGNLSVTPKGDSEYSGYARDLAEMDGKPTVGAEIIGYARDLAEVDGKPTVGAETIGYARDLAEVEGKPTVNAKSGSGYGGDLPDFKSEAKVPAKEITGSEGGKSDSVAPPVDRDPEKGVSSYVGSPGEAGDARSEIGRGAISERTGLEGLPLPEKYKGEEESKGWQKDHKLQGLQFQTRYFNEDERNKSKVRFDETGTATSDGGELNGPARGFVVDPETGTVHQFEGKGVVAGDKILATHHSSPLRGADVAGAGNMVFKDGRLTGIDDQSGHYKPGGKFTFQAVRAVNMANFSDELKEKLRKTASSSKDGGEAESPDTMEQLIAAEIQKKRESYFKELDEMRAELEDEAEHIENENDRAAALEEIEREYRSEENHFRDVARAVEQQLLKDLPAGSTLLGPNNKETKVSLLGKAGMLSEEEYMSHYKEMNAAIRAPMAIYNDPSNSDEERAAAARAVGDAQRKMHRDVNRASALKQLQQPLGEAAFADLLRHGGDAVTAAMINAKLTPGKPGEIDKLKALLGETRVKSLTDQEIDDLSQTYGVAKVDYTRGGADEFGFAIGKKTASTLTAQQFLQTGGNEAQIRNKDRLNKEINKDSAEKELQDDRTFLTASSKRLESIRARLKDFKIQEIQVLENDLKDLEKLAQPRDPADNSVKRRELIDDVQRQIKDLQTTIPELRAIKESELRAIKESKGT